MSDAQQNAEEIEESIYDMVEPSAAETAAAKSAPTETTTTTTTTTITTMEREESIYETAEPSKASVESNLQNQNFTYSPGEKKLCFIGNDVDSIPTQMIYEFGLKTLVLDLSFNCISDLRDLHQFPNLEELICDNNCISDESQLPKLDNLKIFSCNKNKVENLHIFIDKVKVFFPNLTYLSLLGNQACPNQLIDANKDDYDYSRYRKYVIYRLKNLKFLDCYEVTQQEREMVAKDALFYDVVKYQDGDPNAPPTKTAAGGAERQPTMGDYYSPLPNQTKPGTEENPQGSFGYCKYVYYGKQSEGNRFIRNDDL